MPKVFGAMPKVFGAMPKVFGARFPTLLVIANIPFTWTKTPMDVVVRIVSRMDATNGAGNLQTIITPAV